MRSSVNGFLRVPAREEAFLLDLARQPGRAILRAKRRRLLAERRRIVGEHRELLDHLVLGRQEHARGAENRVDPRREHFDRVRDGRRLLSRQHRKLDARALRSPDPVPLHRQHFFGPLAQLLDALQQVVRVVRDLEKPLLEIARRDRRAAAPAAAVDHLLVGEHGLILLAPVHRRAPAIREAALVHLDEQPLVPLVVASARRSRTRDPRHS